MLYCITNGGERKQYTYMYCFITTDTGVWHPLWPGNNGYHLGLGKQDLSITGTVRMHATIAATLTLPANSFALIDAGS